MMSFTAAGRCGTLSASICCAGRAADGAILLKLWRLLATNNLTETLFEEINA
jgi:hypothetical protein